MNNHSLGPLFSSYVVRRLEKGEKVKTFNCGDDDLNDFIINEANLYRDALLAVSYVFEHEDDTRHENIAAYFSLANLQETEIHGIDYRRRKCPYKIVIL